MAAGARGVATGRGERGERESSLVGEEEIREVDRTKGGNRRSEEIGETWAGPTTMASRALVMER